MRINPNRKSDGSLIPNWLKIRNTTEICQGSKLCYGELLRHGYSGRCFPRLEVLAAELGVNRKQAQRYIKNLKDLKLIEIEEHPGHSNHYFFLLHEWMIEECQDIASNKHPPKGYPDLEKVFADGLQEKMTHPLTWNVWREIPAWERRSLSYHDLKKKIKNKYEYFLAQIEKGKKLKTP